MTEKLAVINALLECHAKQMLCLVAIDKAHLYAEHGLLFQDAMGVLTTLFFTVIIMIGEWHLLFLAMTTTMTCSLLFMCQPRIQSPQSMVPPPSPMYMVLTLGENLQCRPNVVPGEEIDLLQR